jgi:hypothetical protein
MRWLGIGLLINLKDGEMFILKNLDTDYGQLYFKSYKALENYYLKYASDLVIDITVLNSIKQALKDNKRIDFKINVRYITIIDNKKIYSWDYGYYCVIPFEFET